MKEHEVTMTIRDESVLVQGIKFDCNVEYNTCPESAKMYETEEQYERNMGKYADAMKRIKELTGLTDSEIIAEIDGVK